VASQLKLRSWAACLWAQTCPCHHLVDGDPAHPAVLQLCLRHWWVQQGLVALPCHHAGWPSAAVTDRRGLLWAASAPDPAQQRQMGASRFPVLFIIHPVLPLRAT